jgi:hypothetical protein
VKFQVITNNHGIPMSLDGPFQGNASDFAIWKDSSIGSNPSDYSRFLVCF